jgi:hypothetical protein
MLLDPAGHWKVPLLLRVADPITRLGADPAIYGAREYAQLGDVQVTALRRVMTNGKISLAAGKVRGLERFDKLKGNSGWRRVFGRAADMMAS